MAKTPATQQAAANAKNAAAQSPEEHEEHAVPAGNPLLTGFAGIGASYLASMGIHMLLFIIMALIFGGQYIEHMIVGEAPEFEAVETEPVVEAEITKFELGDPQLDPTELDTDTLMETEYDPVPQEAEYNDDSAVFEKKGGGVADAVATNDAFGGLGMNIQASGLGPAVRGAGGVGTGVGFGKNAGSGGDGVGFGGRGAGKREAIAGGGTKQSERAVAAALNWIARHQNPDGSWSLEYNRGRCSDQTCTNEAKSKSTAGATALGLLPFLAAGQTHMSKGPYQKSIYGGINALIRGQKANGDLSGGESQMYSHGLATIALCEAYGMSGDSRLGASAQAALKFIETAQNNSGGWRYTHGTPDTDTSVVGWQVMALKSGHMAGLQVNPAAFDRARKGLVAGAGGDYKGLFSYEWDKKAPTPTMTGVGLLCLQYLGTNRNDPGMSEGASYLMKHQPGKGGSNIYYYYYATQVMHNLPGPDWETWNRAMRRQLVESQVRGGCAEGSWSPQGDQWGGHAGRLFQTSLSCLTLEVYYRYLPLFKIDDKKNVLDNLDKAAGAAAAPAKK